MDMLLLALSIGVPLIRFLLFPARTMGRGGHRKYLGAVMIVGLMMALWLGVQSLGTITADLAGGHAQANAPAPRPAGPDLDGLAQF
jgi:hypothetical protein